MTKETIASDDYILDMFEERYKDCGNLMAEGDAENGEGDRNDKRHENERIQDNTIVKETLSNVEDGNIPMEQSMVVYDDIHEELRAKTQLLKKAKKKIEGLANKMSDLQRKFESERTNYLETIRKQNQQIKLTNQIINKIQPLIGKEYNYSNIQKIRTKCYWDEESQKWHIPELVVQKKLPTPGVRSGKRRSPAAASVKKYFDDSSDEEFFRELEKIEEDDIPGPSVKRRGRQPLISLDEGSEPTEYDMTMDTIVSSDDSPEKSEETFNQCGRLTTDCGTQSNDKGLEGETNRTITKEKDLDGLNEPTEDGTTIASCDEASDMSKERIDESRKVTTECSADSNDKELEGESNNTVTSEKGNVKNNSMITSITCKLCLYECSSQAEYLDHYQIHSTQKQQTCGKCGKTFNCKATLRQHLSVHSDARPYTCEICGKGFKQFGHKSQHVQSHSNEQPHTCEICNKTFPKRSALKCHMRSHNKEKPPVDKPRVQKSHVCEFCGKAFADKGNFNVHRRIHTNEKPYSCKDCGKSFTQWVTWKQHTATHSDERPYSCEMCSSTFRMKHHLRRHMRAHKNIKPHQCTICGKAFVASCDLKCHLRAHSNERPFKCEICGNAFKRKFTLKTHMSTHKKERPDNFTSAKVACDSEVKTTNLHYRIPWYDVCNLNID